MKWVKYFFAVAALWLPVFASLAQSPVAEFSISPEVCIEEQLQIENLSQNATSFEWDFCEGDLSNTPEAGNITFLPGSFNPKDITLIKDDNDFWFGFVAVRSTNELYRLNFGTDPSNKIAQVDNLGNLNGAINNPEQVEFRKENGSYYGFVLNSGDETLSRLSFGNSLLNVPSSETIYSNIGTVNGGMDIAKNDGLWYAVFSHSTDRTLQILRIGNSLSGNPGVADFIETPAIPGLIGADPITIAHEMDMWYVFVGGSSSRTIHRVSFGNTLFNSNPSSAIINSSSIGSSRPAGLEIARDQGSFFLLVQLLDGRVQTWSLGASLENDVEEVNDFGNLGLLNNSDCVELVKDESSYTAFTLNSATRFVQSYTFPDNCFSNISFTTDPNPVSVFYQQGGSYWISLTAFNEDGASYAANQVNVKNSLAPDAGFSSFGNCSGTDINFLINESNASSIYLWDFGDGSQSSQINPQHTYTAPGDYNVSLYIESADGCINSSQETISVFEPPTADFNVPVAICSNSLVVFQNLNTTDYKGLATYTWTVEGDLAAQTKDLAYIFPEEGVFEITLNIELPGCFARETKIITVQPGPNPSFIVSDACVGTSFNFSNTSSGDISGYIWDFGDGTSSTLESPVYTYNTPGDYTVRLTAFNDAGCETSIEQLVTVYSEPIPEFITELACESNPVQFTDQSSVPNANIESWFWDFGNGTTSQEQNPTAQFNSDGNYMVNLTVTSTFGCESTITRNIEVLPSPEVSFSYSDVCTGEEVQFTDESIPPPGETITEWAWDLGGEFSSDRNPVKTFDFPIEYDVSLTVQASNQCIGSEQKTLLVPATPEIDFSIRNNCVGAPTLFRDLSVPGNDPVTGRIWDFGGLGIATGEEVSFEFPRTGEFLVSLTLETANGCTYTESRQITILDPPVAEFSAEPLAGAPPLEVDFVNLSQGAETHAWYVNEELISTEENISYTFNELASYDVRLEVFNVQGCSDQFVQTISAVEPETDLRADELVPIRLNGQIEFQFKATNLGNVPVSQIPVRLILNDRVELTDVVEVNLQAGETSTFRLPFKVEDSSFDFVCAEIEDTIQGFPDKDPTNNSACFIFSEQPGLSAPYPNPAADALFFNIYTDGPGEFETEVMNNFGQVVVAPAVIVERTGKYIIKIDLSGLSQGHYLLKVNTGSSFEAFQFVINR